MASVSSLDQDMRKLRLGRYTPQAANEARTWVEDTLGEKLPPGDLLEVLKDGTALCRLANLVLPPPGIRFKKSAMPFIQMENISHFLRVCEQPPLSLPAHDRFLTVDLFESKDPAQVLQCLGAFSRAANAAKPSAVPTTMGIKRSGQVSPTHSGYGNGASTPDTSRFGGSRGISSASSGSRTFNPAKSPPPLEPKALSPSRTGGSTSSRATDVSSPAVSSWSKKGDQGVTSPAWNIHQYGYMGGANQGSQGVVYGARRQITSAAPHVPSLAEKQRKRREQEEEEERLRVAAEEAEKKRQVERQAEEERARVEEEARWEEESRKRREEEKAHVERQKREWEEQEKRWKIEEEQRLREERAMQEAMQSQGVQKHATGGTSDGRLRGQYYSEYQAEQSTGTRSRTVSRGDPELMAERQRVQDLERQLAEAKEREKQYEREREGRHQNQHQPEDRKHRSRSKSRPRSESRPRPPPREPSPDQSEASWVAGGEREYVRGAYSSQPSQRNPQPPPPQSSRPLPEPKPPAFTPRPLPEPQKAPARPLPDPTAYANSSQNPNRTSRYLANNPAPVSSAPRTHAAPELTSTNERAAEDARRLAGQQRTKAGGWASKSLLEREMERERERQKEWEEAQKAAQSAPRDTSQGVGPGQSWDVNQYGFTGGDSQNRGGGGIGFGGRRQIIGPRPRP